MALRRDLDILVVDDMSVSREILRQALERFGVARVETADCAEAALEAMRGRVPDVVISDLRMPGMDGVELLALLRQGRRTRDVRFVLTSGLDASPRFGVARRLGIQGLLVKPFRTEALLACVEGATGRL